MNRELPTEESNDGGENSRELHVGLIGERLILSESLEAVSKRRCECRKL
jgi:hypothetical protein